MNSLLEAIEGTRRLLFLVPNQPIRPTRLCLGIVGPGIVLPNFTPPKTIKHNSTKIYTNNAKQTLHLQKEIKGH